MDPSDNTIKMIDSKKVETDGREKYEYSLIHEAEDTPLAGSATATSSFSSSSNENNDNEKSNLLSNHDSDVVVVGAGIVGLCFARDIASMGYTVVIVERDSQVGGVWSKNNYPGLRLHSPGYNYRCLSVVPIWNLEHSMEEHYRPTRMEVLKYCQELSKHKNITIVLNTNCNYENHQVFVNGISVQIGEKQHYARFLFVSGTFSTNWSGSPHFPASIPESFQSRAHDPMCLHSSKLTTKKFVQIRKKERVVIVGASKAALDLLQLFAPGDTSVLWAHRGHSAFYRREDMLKAIDDKEDITVKHVMKYISKALDEAQGRHWSSLAIEDGSTLLCKCEGPITSQKVKTGVAFCSQKEISHANTFKQFHLDSIEVSEEQQGMKLVGKDHGNDLWISNNDCVIFCTGQRNHDFSPPKFAPNYVQSGPFSGSVAMSALVPLQLAVEQLRGKREISTVAEQLCEELMHSLLLKNERYSRGRELDWAIIEDCAKIRSLIFPACGIGDPAYYPKWSDQWYARTVTVDEAFQSLRSSLLVGSPVSNTDRLTQLISELSGLVAKVLSLERHQVKPGTNVLTLGFNSVNAAQLNTHLKKMYQVELSPLTVFEHPTIEELARVIAEGREVPVKMASERGKTVPILIDHASVLSKWFVQRSTSSESKTEDTVLLFCFPGLGGDSLLSFPKISEELPRKIVPYVVIYPWEKPESEASLMSNISEYVECLCETIAKGVVGYDFALFGHSAGGCLAYLVEKRLRTRKFDLAPILAIVANGPPPHVAASAAQKPFSSFLPRLWKDNPTMQEYMTKTLKTTSSFWRKVWRQSGRVWRSEPGFGSRLLILGGDADPVLPRWVLNRWLTTSKAQPAMIKLFQGGNHFTPLDEGHSLYKEFWVTVGTELSISQRVSSDIGKGFGPIRSSLRPVSQDEFILYQTGLMYDGHLICGSLCFEGYLSLETLTKKVEEAVLSQPRFFRFRSKIDAARKEWVPVENWSASSHMGSSSDRKILWQMSLQHVGHNTTLLFRCNHAVGDGFCVREFFGAITGSSASDIPSILLRRPPMFSAWRQKEYEACLKRIKEKHPLPPPEATSRPYTVVPVELESLSLRSVKAYAKKDRATVTDVLLMMVSEVKRCLSEPHNWLGCTVANRSAFNWNILGNVAQIFPVYVGNGELSTIQNYSRKQKFLLYLAAKGKVSSINPVNFDHYGGNIVGVSNMIGLPRGEMLGHKLIGQQFHVTFSGMVCVISMGDRLTCTFTTKKSNMEFAHHIQKAWSSLVGELGLGFPSQCDDPVSLSVSTALLQSGGLPLQAHDLCLEDYEELHRMTCPQSRAQRILNSFSGGIILVPHNYIRDSHSIPFIRGYTDEEYHALTLTTCTRESTAQGETTLLVARDVVASEDCSIFIADHDDGLQVDPCVFEVIREQTNSRALKVMRHFEYYFGGKANMSMMALHVKSTDTGLLSLVEVFRKGARTAAQTKRM